jgi:glucosamine 6-phosphate synthetase-like amidotransferase/phosphosugar isomerase protein
MRQSVKQQVIMLANGILQNANMLKHVFQNEGVSDAECRAMLIAFTTLTDEDNKILKEILKNTL